MDRTSPHNKLAPLLLAWLLVMGPVVLVHFALQHHPAPPACSAGAAPIYTGLSWLRFHRVNAPRATGEKHLIVIGSSNLAGWGSDYRWVTRQRIDPWGRNSFAQCLEEELRRSGMSVRVSNLAVNGARLRSQMFLYLYALEKKPDAIIFGLSSWSFIRDGDFRDPKNMLPMNRGLAMLLKRQVYAGKEKTEASFLEYLRQQPAPKWDERLDPSSLDLLTAGAAREMLGLYTRIGLPEFIEAPTPPAFARQVALSLQETQPAKPSDDEHLPIFEEMENLFPQMLPILKATADQAGVRLIALAPPNASAWVGRFNGRRTAELRQAGIEVVDLRGLPMRPGIETFDGHHFTREGNLQLAGAFARILFPTQEAP